MTGQRDDLVQARITTALTTLITLHDKTFHPDLPKTTGATGKPGSKPPAPIGPISARRHTRDLLATYVDLAIEETGVIARPWSHTIPEQARWMRSWAGWFARHDTGPDTAAELERAAHVYVQVTTPPAGKWVKVGHCPEEDGGDVAVWLPADAAVDWVGECVCNVDPAHVWSRGEWQLLARLQGDEAPQYLTGAELAEWLCSRLQARVTHRHVWNWVRRYPEVAAMADDGGRLDRVRFALWWLERRERTAA